LQLTKIKLELKTMTDLTRRQFISTAAITAGFAIAAEPIFAQLITTDAQGIIAGAVKIPVKDREISAYRAMPEKATNLPTVLVIQEIFGVHAHIQDVCRRFAKLGYLAIAPNLFERQGDVLALTEIDQIRQIVAKVPDAQVMSDLDFTAIWAAKNRGDRNRLAITGFCWGGRIVWLYAAHNPNLKAGVAWYGKLVATQTNPLTPKQPIDLAKSLKAPVLGLYGGADPGIPNESVAEMQSLLKSVDSPSQIMLYPDMPHAFFADYRASYRAETAKDGWKRLQNWFIRYGLKA
jgi:carboxymethylenebutenolidase